MGYCARDWPRPDCLARVQEIIRKLLVDVAKHAPETAFLALVNEVLSEPGNWEPSLVGLQALLTILLEGPQHSAHALLS